jgi:hypothetical protein
MLDREKMKELYTIDALTGWLRQQPPGEEYQWQDPVFCLMGRYLAANGSRWGEASYLQMPGYEHIASAKPWTFGAALERAEQLQLPPPPLQISAPVRERETVDAE